MKSDPLPPKKGVYSRNGYVNRPPFFCLGRLHLMHFGKVLQLQGTILTSTTGFINPFSTKHSFSRRLTSSFLSFKMQGVIRFCIPELQGLEHSPQAPGVPHAYVSQIKQIFETENSLRFKCSNVTQLLLFPFRDFPQFCRNLRQH